MEKMRKRIWACLIAAMLAALFIGIVYYYYHAKDTAGLTEGTLIASLCPAREGWIGHVFR